MKRVAVFCYGFACYVMFLGVFAYSIGFIGNLFVPKSIDSDPAGPLGVAIIVNVLLLGVFAVQHSVMARPAFKRWWTKIVPEPVERSTYVLFSNLALILLFWQWRPMGGVVWDIQEPVLCTALFALYGVGWLVILVSTLLINHFDLFGLRQVWLYFRGKPYTHLEFKTPGLYKHIRHPLYVGWFIAFWATPTMSIAHLVFACATTAYILIAVQIEERDLLKYHDEYAKYRHRVPMFLPKFSRKRSAELGSVVQDSSRA